MITNIFDEYPFRKNLSIDYHWIKKDFPYPHNHDYWEFFFVTNERLEHSINGKRLLMNKGDGYLIRPTDCHSLKRYNDADPTHINLLIRCEVIKNYCDSLREGLYETMLASDEIPIKLDNHQFKKIIEYVTLLQATIPINNQKSFISKLLLHYILEIILSKYFIWNTEFPEWFNELIMEINKPANIGSFTRDILNTCNYSHTHVLRLFKQYTGKTLVEYIVQVKMENASEMLLHSDMSTLEIAGTLGYNSLSHFNHVFKKTFGVSPSQYKKSQK